MIHQLALPFSGERRRILGQQTKDENRKHVSAYPSNLRTRLWVVLAVLLIRLPFLNQAIQGDDVYYLAGAQHAQLDPLHPNHTKYVFMGKMVDMQGHPHPPFNAWYLGALLAVVGDIKEVPFHAAYVPFSLIAALSMLSIARRFTERPLLATLIFIAVPPFFVNGNSLESDLPFLAFWMLAMSAYLNARPVLATVAACLAALCAYQAILLAPIFYFTPAARRRNWFAVAAPLATIGAFQLFERLTFGALPAAVLGGYMQSYGWAQIAIKLKNAAALTGHLGVTLVSPIAWLGIRKRPHTFLLYWIGIFFPGALAIFFAGSARYLLPLAAPLCIIAANSKFAVPALVLQGALSIAMAVVNYQHWDGYRQIALEVPNARRVFVHGEWGLRFYMEQRGAIPLETGQKFRAGDIIVSSAYAEPLLGSRALLSERVITSEIPLRLVGLGSRSAYSSVGFGLLPYGISKVPMDRVRIEAVNDFKPTLEFVTINASEEANRHIAAGVSANDRWALKQASLLVKRPAAGGVLRVKFYVPANGMGRNLEVLLDGVKVTSAVLDHDGIYELTAAVGAGGPETASITIQTDKALKVDGDQRELGVILVEVGFAAR